MGEVDYISLHPAQRELVERDYNGPARVAGSAGTEQDNRRECTAQFFWLRKYPLDSRVLLTTFSEPLSNALATKLRHLIGNQPRLGERIEVQSLNAIGRRLYESNIGKPRFATADTLRELLLKAAQETPESRFSLHRFCSRSGSRLWMLGSLLLGNHIETWCALGGRRASKNLSTCNRMVDL